MNIGLALKTLRLRKRITQTELSDRTGISQAWLSQIEKSKRSPEMRTIEKILTALNTGYGDFVIQSLEFWDFEDTEKMNVILPVIKNMLL